MQMTVPRALEWRHSAHLRPAQPERLGRRQRRLLLVGARAARASPPAPRPRAAAAPRTRAPPAGPPARAPRRRRGPSRPRATPRAWRSRRARSRHPAFAIEILEERALARLALEQPHSAASATASAQAGKARPAAEIGDRFARCAPRSSSSATSESATWTSTASAGSRTAVGARSSPRERREDRVELCRAGPHPGRICPRRPPGPGQRPRQGRSAPARPATCPVGRVSRETPVGPSGKRRDDQVAVGLLALAVGLHVGALAQVLVDDPPLPRGHRVELHGSARLQRLLGGVVGVVLQRSAPGARDSRRRRSPRAPATGLPGTRSAEPGAGRRRSSGRAGR